MLIIGEIFTFKLTSSEEMVAKVTAITENSVTITAPVSVVPNGQGMGLITTLFTADPKEPITLNLGSVMVIAKTEETIKNKYIEATSKIVLPEKKKLILG